MTDKKFVLRSLLYRNRYIVECVFTRSNYYTRICCERKHNRRLVISSDYMKFDMKAKPSVISRV